MVKLIILALILIITTTILHYSLNTHIDDIEGMVEIPNYEGDIKWTRNKSCRYKMGKTIKYILEKIV